LANQESQNFSFTGVSDALALGSKDAAADVRLFGKPSTRPYRRMAVALATGQDTDTARKLAKAAADKVQIVYH
jgi:phosphoribosylglycinamide formyltransferase 2